MASSPYRTLTQGDSMKTIITAQHFKLTDSLKEHIETQFLKLDKYNLDKSTTVRVVLHPPGHNGRVLGHAEAKLTMIGKEVFAEAEHADVYIAADSLIPKMLKQMDKIHSKTVSHRKTSPENT